MYCPPFFLVRVSSVIDLHYTVARIRTATSLRGLTCVLVIENDDAMLHTELDKPKICKKKSHCNFFNRWKMEISVTEHRCYLKSAQVLAG
ncbi:hypothetical protein M378DRAFT_362725 [Amanita muscaria Koide BX008]|uniref:Uncharacterized protein n=1 Tax=Amanita muscaria (strain Koide BX008) TaxID=946122 RepID=A0A0C2W952_AMAMK|nr:hypothetical protein M378DRAFT_362725 [Amanita muscaria Koide BX008]